MVEKWKLKLVYNNIIRFIFTMSQYPQSSIISLSVPFFIITGGNRASLFTTAPTPSSCCGLCLLLLFLSHDLRVSGHPLLFRHPCIGSLLIGSLGLSLVLLGGLLSCKVPLVAPGHLRQCSPRKIPSLLPSFAL